MAILFTLRVYARNLLEEDAEAIFFSYLVWLEMADLGFETRPNVQQANILTFASLRLQLHIGYSHNVSLSS